jgi:hypothetical protein
MAKQPIDPRHLTIVAVPIKMTVAVRDACLTQSRKLPGCKRPHVGSIAHFINQAALEKLDRVGVRFKRLYPEVYDKSTA